VSDHLSDILFAPTAHAMKMLKNEGLGGRSYLVGDVMVELLRKNMHKLNRRYIERLGLSEGGYVLCTIHRQDNVDVKKNLSSIFEGLTGSGKRILLPLHPRTRKKIEEFGLGRAIGKNVMIVEPVGYLEMLSMMRFAEKVCTDSGGVQKEAFLLKRPCVTLRTGTEWVETTKAGWNLLVGTDPRRISKAICKFEPSKKWKDVYPISDSARRICKVLRSKMKG
jgi:UDP-GlcNAc3NAcA epimerase